MATQRMLSRTILGVTVIGLLYPILMGTGCPGPEDLRPPADDPGSGQIVPGDTTLPDGSSGGLSISAGPDRAATVGAPILLSGSVTGGQAPYVASWSPSSSLIDANTLTPTFVPASEGEYVFTLVVSDSKGLSGSRSVKVNALDHATLSSLKWGANFAGGGYQLLAAFTKPVDKTTAENVNNYRVSPDSSGSQSTSQPIINPSSAKLGSDQQTVTLLFTGGVLELDTQFDISVNDAIRGADGVAVSEVSELRAVANSDDTKVPTVATRRWAKGTTVDEAETAAEKEIWDDTGIAEEVRYNYMIEVVFSETMDPKSAAKQSSYRIQDGERRYAPTIATLANDGRTLTLIFQDGPLSRDSTLDTGLGSTFDMNDRQLATETNKAVSANADDKTAPAVVQDSVRFVEGVTGGGYQVTVDFNEPMDRTSLEQASTYQLGGAVASSAEADADGRRVKLTFASGTHSSSDKLSIAGNSVRDINGVFLPAQTNLTVLQSKQDETAGPGNSPGVPTLTWLPGTQSVSYQIWVVFPVAVNKSTVENVNNWRITGTNIHPTWVELSDQTAGDAIAGRTAMALFLIDSFSRRDTLDVSVGGAILDINSRPIEQVTLPIAASADDKTPPEIAQWTEPMTLPDGTILPAGTPYVLWCDWSGNPSAGYQVTIQFNETLDGASAANVENYLVGGNTPTAAKLLAGRFVVLEFANLVTPITNTTGLEMISFVRDINGLASSVSTPVQIVSGCDVTPPDVSMVNWVSNPLAYQVAVQFNEAMDRTSAEFLASWTMSDVDGVQQIPTEAVLDLDDPTRLVLTFGAGVFAPDAQLGFAGEVRDISGNVLTAQAGVWPKNIEADPDDAAPLAIVSAVWDVDSMNGYTVLLQFSEPIDGNNQGVYQLDGIDSETLVINDGGCTATVVFPIATNPATFSRGAKITATGIMDLSGDATATDTRDVMANLLDLDGPWVESVEWLTDPITLPYQIVVTFSEVLDAVSAQTTANYQVSGTFIKPDTAELDPADGRTVTLTFEDVTVPTGFTPETQLDVSVGNSVLDINSVPAMQTTQDIDVP